MRRHRTVACGALLLTLLLTLLAGCGDDSDDDASVGPSSAPTTDSSAETDTEAETDSDGDCAWLGADDVSEAVGADLVETSAGSGGCRFAADEGAASVSPVSVTVSHLVIGIDPEVYADGTRDLCEGEIVESDAGDIAFACSTGFALQGFLFEGSDSVVVAVDGTDDDAAGVAIAADLLDAANPSGQ